MPNAFRETGAYGEQWRVTLPASKKLPPVPNPGLVSPSKAGSDGQSSHREPKNSKILRYHLLACDQRSFLTGSRRVDMQAAYIINAVCREDSQLKTNVEELLTQQHLHPPSFQTFELDSIINVHDSGRNLSRSVGHLRHFLHCSSRCGRCSRHAQPGRPPRRWTSTVLTGPNGTLLSSTRKAYSPMARHFQPILPDPNFPAAAKRTSGVGILDRIG
ncbi:hypothetical protein APHAL10511_005060 [Amanita phalloides]|nr:hypothetical protein APHAL10511_005060 [Amanita phalloides]